MHILKYFNSTSIIQLSPKNLRISAILVSIFKVLLSHVVLFVMLLGLAHAEEMTTILSADISDQRERQEYLDLPTNSRGETLNQIRFNTASHLASVTLVILCIGTAMASVYLFSCLALLIGTLRNRSELILPFLILDFLVSIVIGVVVAFGISCNIIPYFGGTVQFWIIIIILKAFDVFFWLIVHGNYLNLRHIKKLTEVATVSVPFPFPQSQIPFYYRKENMYLNSGGGYKHLLLTESETSYVV